MRRRSNFDSHMIGETIFVLLYQKELELESPNSKRIIRIK